MKLSIKPGCLVKLKPIGPPHEELSLHLVLILKEYFPSVKIGDSIGWWSLIDGSKTIFFEDEIEEVIQ